MKPFKPGSPTDENVTNRNTAANFGIGFQSPPKSAICRVCRRS